MSMTALQVLRHIAPEFASLSDDEVNFALELAAQEVPESVWGNLTAQGRARLAAHRLSLSHPELSAGGVVASESVGSVSRSYAVTAGSDAELSSTQHGVEYARLRRLVGIGAMVI